MTERHVMRIVANNSSDAGDENDDKYWTTWVGPELTDPVSSLREAVERADEHGDALIVQPEAYAQMVAAGVAKPGANPGANWHDFA
jgi:hypothetical protein